MINSLLGPILERLPENNRLERIWKIGQTEFRSRYYNDKLGLLWALLNPLLRICVFYFIFTHVLKTNKEDNFAIFLFGGLVLWMSFTEGSQKGLRIIKSKKYLIENIQFNHQDLFFSSTLATMLGFLFNLSAYLTLCLIFGYRFGFEILLMPILIISVFLLCTGTAMILATISIFIKDITHAWTIIVLFGFWTSGIFFRGETYYDIWAPIVYIQPFVGIIMNMRHITIGIGSWHWDLALINFLVALIVYFLGSFLFKKYSHYALEKL